MRRISCLSRFLISLFLLFIYTGYVYAQSQDTGWASITSYNTVNGIDLSGDDTIWGVSNGGLFAFQDQEFTQTFTPVDGMHRLDGSTLIYIEEINSIAIGYIDGMIDLYNIGEDRFDRVEDISRVQAFTSKQINDFELHNGSLYIATEFGIVVYNIDTFLVSNSYTKIGSFDRGTPVFDIHIDNETIITGTQQGVAVGSLNDNLDIEASWANYDESSGLPSGNIESVTLFNAQVLASSSSSVVFLTNGSWQEYSPLSNYSNVTFKGITDGNSNSDGLLLSFTTNRVLLIDQNDNLTIINPGIAGISDVFMDGQNSTSIATITSGLGRAEGVSNDFTYFAPSGPNLNFFQGISFSDGTLISGTTPLSQRNSIIDNRKGYYIRDESGWRNFNRSTNEVLDQFQFIQAFNSTFTDNYYYFGSWGRGIARHDRETDQIDVFNSSNSSLRGWAADDPDFPVISGLQTDSDGAVWATSRYATNPLYVQLPGENEWINYGKSSAVSQNDEYLYLFVDSFNQKWISLQTAGGTGRGVLVLDTGVPSIIEESTGVKLTEDQGSGNLPDASVTAIIEDKEGEVWIGTERGIARFIFPQFVITGSPEERRAQWLINEDQDAVSPFLLRDINVTAMAVNSANQKWIGTAAEGVWLLNETGGSILKRFTSENSPLFSDAIRDISVNEKTGEVYISTDAGLSIYQDVPIAPSTSMDKLKVYPNPFLYESHDNILIENLSEITTIRILGVDGTLIRTISSRGGRAEWNGLDASGRRVGSGMYVVVALDNDGNERGFGKVAIIR